MERKKPIDLGNRISLIDGFDLGMWERTGAYVIEEEQLTLIEPGPSPAIPLVLEGLKDLGLDPKDIKYIIVTHIHLDHGGGTGLLLEHCPDATVVVHPKAARHIIDPTRLIAGARMVYKEKFDKLFNPVLPVPEDRVIVKEDGETLSIGPNCTLTFFDSPGHANHHFSIYDPVSNGIFTGDTTGIQYLQTLDLGFTFYLPTTSPNQFDPDAMLRSIKRFQAMNLDRIYFGHFGMTTEVERAFAEVSEWIPRFIEVGKKGLAEGKGEEGIADNLMEMVRNYLKNERQVPDDHYVYKMLKMDLDVCAMGIADYLNKNMKG